MPKIIQNVRGKILDYCKEQLLSGNVEGLHATAIAKNCGIAVGTIFNYFPGKEMIFATVLLEDWKACYAQMQEDCATQTTLCGATEAMMNSIRAFCEKYFKTWRAYRGGNDFYTTLRTRHEMLCSQLSELLAPLCMQNPNMAQFVASSVLWITQEDEQSYLRDKQTLLGLVQH